MIRSLSVLFHPWEQRASGNPCKRACVRLCRVVAILSLIVMSLSAVPATVLAVTMESPEWNALMAAAKAEGSLTVAGYGSREYDAVYSQFSRKYGIKMVISYAGGSEHADRILAERRAGIFAVDVGHVGANTVNRRLIPAKAVAPIMPYLMLDEITDPKNWYGERLWFIDEAQQYVLAHSADFERAFVLFVNTKVVKDEDIKALRSPDDLLSDKWRKKVVALSPNTAQVGNSYFRYTMLPKPFGAEWMERFIKSGAIEFVSNSRLIEDGLAGGKYAIAVFPNAPPLDQMEKQGLPVKRIEHEFADVPGIMTAGAPTQAVQIYDRAPHPNAAKLFVNWLLSREGMTYVHDHPSNSPFARNSLRKDVPKTNVDPATLPEAGVEYYAVDALPEFQSQRDDIMKKVQDWYKAARP